MVKLKKVMSLVLSAALVFALLPANSIIASAYDANAAVAYAREHWNDGIGLCAEFVSRCLAAGGVTIPNRAYYSSSKMSYNGIGGTLGSYTNPYTCSEAQLVYFSEQGYTIIEDPADSQISVGDVVFLYGSNHNTSGRDNHVGICISTDNGITYAAHNRATVTGKLSSSYPCTYVVKMNGTISAPTNAWVALPNGPESSYLPNTAVDITFGADNATSYYIEMYRGYNGQTDFYYSITLTEGVLHASFDKLGHYSCFVVASNSVGSVRSDWIGWDIVDAPPTNVWVAVPNGPESSYLPNTTVDITFGADNATSYYLEIWRGYNGETNWYYSESFSSGICCASFDKLGHYSCFIIARNAAGETRSEWIGWDIVESKPSELSITADESYYAVNSTVNFTLNAKYGYYKHIGIHKILDTGNQLYYEQDVAGTSCSVTITEPGNYCANFDAFNACGTTRSGWVYFSVFDKKPGKPTVTVTPGTSATATEISWNSTTDTKYYDIYIKDADGNLVKYETDYHQTEYSIVLPKGAYQVNVCSCGYVYNWWTPAGYLTFVVDDVPILNPSDERIIINQETHFIYGLSAGAAQSCVAVTDGTAAYEYSNTKQAFGTGTKINIFNNDNQLVDSYTVVVFGDIDGDSWYDGTDAYFVRLVANGLINADALTDAQRMAADCNHDGLIDSADVAILEQAGLLLNQIDQNLPSEEPKTNSVYLDYCSLIDQSIEIVEPEAEQSATDEEPAQPAAQNLFSRMMAIFTAILNRLLGIFKIA